MNTATATVYKLPVREPLHLVHLETGELLTDGEESLNELADQVSALLDRQVRDAWELGRLVALARLRCEDKDCGIDGRNPNERFGKWVCTNFMQTNRNSILNARRLIKLPDLKNWFWFGRGPVVRTNIPSIQYLPAFMRFKHKQQKQYNQMNDTWGVLVPVETIAREVRLKKVNPLGLFGLQQEAA